MYEGHKFRRSPVYMWVESIQEDTEEMGLNVWTWLYFPNIWKNWSKLIRVLNDNNAADT